MPTVINYWIDLSIYDTVRSGMEYSIVDCAVSGYVNSLGIVNAPAAFALSWRAVSIAHSSLVMAQ